MLSDEDVGHSAIVRYSVDRRLAVFPLDKFNGIEILHKPGGHLIFGKGSYLPVFDLHQRIIEHIDQYGRFFLQVGGLFLFLKVSKGAEFFCHT